MTGLLIAIAVLTILISSAWRLASWIKTSGSQRAKDRLVAVLAVTFAAGGFFCFPVWAAFPLAAAVGLFVAADFFTRKRGSSHGSK